MKAITAVAATGTAIALLCAVPGAAQTSLEDNNRRSWEHERTGIVFPREIAGADRFRMLDISDAEYDVLGNYQTRNQNLLISLYVYRGGLPDLGPNVDMVLRGIISREGYTPDKAANLQPIPFQPSGHPQPDSLMVAFDVASGGAFRTGAVALIPHEEWVVKIRISSNDHAVEDYPAVFAQIVDELEMPQPAFHYGPAVLVTPCETSLQTGSARLVEPRGALVLGHLISLSVDVEAEIDEQTGNLREQQAWCRDLEYGDSNIYRRDGQRDAYVDWLSDAGSVIEVGRDRGLLDELDAETEGAAVVLRADSNGSTIFGFLSALPSPENLGESMRGARELGSTNRDPEGMQILLSPDLQGTDD